jgi:hypothetical protein
VSNISDIGFTRSLQVGVGLVSLNQNTVSARTGKHIEVSDPGMAVNKDATVIHVIPVDELACGMQQEDPYL